MSLKSEGTEVLMRLEATVPANPGNAVLQLAESSA